MKKNKSLELLKTFSPDELKRFGDFLRSPYFNTSIRVSKLFETVKKYYPDFDSAALEKKKLYSKVLPGKAYNDQIIKNLNSELFRLEKEFLAVDNYVNSPHEKSIGLVMQLTSREIDQLFIKEAEHTEAEIREDVNYSDKLTYHLFQIEEERFKNNIFNNKQSLAAVNSVKSGEYLITYFLKNLLRMSINNHVNRFSLNISSDVDLGDKLISLTDLEKLLSYMESHKIEGALNIKLMYYALICNLEPENDKAYHDFRDLLYKNISMLSRAEASLMFTPLEAVIAQKINSGRTEFYRDLFETYEFELRNGIYNFNESTPMTAMKFRNIYLSAVRAEKFQWAEEFINNYRSKLQKEDRQSVTELALAQINFEKKDFDKTLLHLHKVKTGQIFYKVDVKILNLMAFYELSHFESAVSLIDSFRRLLNSNTSLTEQYREKNINFINSLNALMKLKLDNDKAGAAKLGEKISAVETIAHKKWLLKKISEV
jgi:hypothetical protein